MALASESWTFFTNYAHVLLCIAEDPEARMREIAVRIGITERAVQRVIDDLASSGYLEIIREGRRNRYRLLPHRHLRHPLEKHCEIDVVLQTIMRNRPKSPQKKQRADAARRTSAPHESPAEDSSDS